MKARFAFFLIVALIFEAGIHGSCLAERQSFPPTNLDIPFLDRREIGARWAGMGGACIAIVDDGSAAWWNPAGLGKIRRIEILGTLNNQSHDIEVDWLDRDNESSMSTTRFGNIAFSYPIPTYRGSMVATASVFRTTSFDQYLDRRGGAGAADHHDIEEKKAVLTGWSGAFAVQLSPNAFFGAEAHFYSGEVDYYDEWYPYTNCGEWEALFTQDGDLGGYGGTVGLIYVPHPVVSLGLTLRTPQRITVKGEEIWTDTLCNYHYPSIKYDVDLPYSVGVGVGVMPPNSIVAFDIVYTDWHQLGFPGGIRDDAGAFMYDPTTDIRVGAEYALTFAPVRVRAGYAYVPLALNVFDVEKNRSQFSLGAGTVIESSLAVDFAWQRSSFERESAIDAYSEKRTLNRASLGFAFRF